MSNNIPAIVGSILLACLAGYIAWRNAKKVRIANAALIYRNSIDPEKFNEFKGHILHNALAQTFPEFKKTVHEFRLYVSIIDRYRLDRAWKEYNGGDEECPDFLVMYCISDNGPLLLKQRLGKLKKIGEIT